jgi:hypothetical protein
MEVPMIIVRVLAKSPNFSASIYCNPILDRNGRLEYRCGVCARGNLGPFPESGDVCKVCGSTITVDKIPDTHEIREIQEQERIRREREANKLGYI